MFGLPSTMVSNYDDASSSSSIKSGKSGKSAKSGHSSKISESISTTHTTTPISPPTSGRMNQTTNLNVHFHPNSNGPTRDGRSGSISSSFSGSGPPSPTVLFNPPGTANGYGLRTTVGSIGSMGSVPEESSSYASSTSSSYNNNNNNTTHPIRFMSGATNPHLPTVQLEHYRQCLQWLQQTCRPVFMKEFSDVHTVPVPITAANALHPSQIGGTQTVLVANWKQAAQVQILPVDRWGEPQDVLLEVQALHKLRKCRQIIQLYGYLPNASFSDGHHPNNGNPVPALLLQQPNNGSLKQFLDHNFDLIQWPERYKLALDVAQGLRFLSSQGIECRLHPGNVLVDVEGVAILTGFASSLVASAPCQMTAQPSTPSQLAYLAPERVQGVKADGSAMIDPISLRSGGGPQTEASVYSLGILLWELSSGRTPFDEIVARAEAGPRLQKTMEQLLSAISKGLREETVLGTPEIYEQLFKMCWEADPGSRPPLEVVEETLQMLVVVEPMDMLMLPGEEMSMTISTVVSDSIDAESLSSHTTTTRSNSVRSVSPGPGQQGQGSFRPFARPTTLHQAISVSNADMTEWFILSGHDLNGYAIVSTYSLECEITPILTCLGHFLPSSLPILKELLDQDMMVNLKLLAKRSRYTCLHVLFDRYLPVKNEHGSAHLFGALDLLLEKPAILEDLNALDIQGYTPLHVLMRNPKISSDDVVKVLEVMIAKGVDTSITSPRDGNVLALAAKYLHFEATRTILATDISASEPESIDQAIEACMTMTGRVTDTFVNLRTKTRELLKLWTGKEGAPRREKVVLKVLQDAGQLDSTGIRAKTKVVHLVPPKQLEVANRFYDEHMKKKRERMFESLHFMPMTMR